MEPCQYRSQRRVQALTTSFLLLVVLPRGIAFLAHRLSPHLNAMGIVHQAIEDAIGDGSIADLLVASARPAAGCPMACPERSRRSLAFFPRRGDPQQSCVLCEGRFILALPCHPERSEGPMYFGWKLGASDKATI